MTTYRVIALDPGGSTGYAMYTAQRVVVVGDDLYPVYTYEDEKWSGGTLGPDEHHCELEVLLEMMQVQEYHVVCESFEFRQRDKDAKRTNINLMSREYIGVAKLVARRLKKHSAPPNVVRYTQQTAARAKGFVPEDNIKLNAAGLYRRTGQTKHERDAYRHLIYYLINEQRRHDLVRKWWRDL